MKLRAAAIFTLALCLLPSCRRDEQAPVEEEKKRRTEEASHDIPLMPANTGDQWLYNVRVEIPASEHTPQAVDTTHQRTRTYLGKVVPHEGMPATDCFEVTAPDTPPEREFVEIQPDKILLRGSARVTENPSKPLWYEPPVPFVVAGMEPGTAGKALNAGNGALSRQIRVIAREEVTVPAGTFPAIRLLMVGNDGALELRRTIWFAPGHGIVREEKTRYKGEAMLYRETQELSAIKRSGE